LTLDIRDSSLKTEITNIRSWTERHEEMLNELEKEIGKRRKWLDGNR
jgi:hypothetical protein